MNRRNFISWVGVGWIASSLPVAIAACTSKNDEKSTSGFQSVGTLSQLDSNKGQILNEKFAVGPILIVRNPADEKTLLAVNPTCTHQGCIVGWQSGEKAFVCPCHGSKFATDGKVLAEPAGKPLATYEVKIENDTILVKAG